MLMVINDDGGEGDRETTHLDYLKGGPQPKHIENEGFAISFSLYSSRPLKPLAGLQAVFQTRIISRILLRIDEPLSSIFAP